MFVVLLVMKRAVALLYMSLTFGVATGCGAFQTLPHFDFNGKSKNHWIVNRIPDYGDGHRDGCIVMGVMKVQLSQVAPDNYIGLVQDVEKIETLMAVTLIVNPGTSIAQEFSTGLSGNFSFQYPQKISQIAFKGLGFREVLVNLP